MFPMFALTMGVSGGRPIRRATMTKSADRAKRPGREDITRRGL